MVASPHDESVDDDGDIGRLERAFSAFMRFDGDPMDPGAREEFLSAHEELRDLLAPMLDGDESEQVEDRAAEAFVRGRVLDEQFRLVREVGSGGMGVVWEARQISLDRRVAVKVLSSSLAFSPRAIARFRRESLVMAKLDHPGIARVLAVGQEHDALWFAMEFVDGGGLDGSIGDGAFGGEDGVRRGVTIALRIAQALEHAHAAGIIHRDVKPANVLMRGVDAPVLTDFGLAHEGGLPSMTLTGAFAGTPQYVSPEQVEGRDVDARSDVFSLGATLYECLTGNPPFDARVVHEVLRNIQTRDPADPRRTRPEIGADLAAVLDRALEKDPKNRYPDARAFAADLGAILDGRPVRARPVGATTRLWRSARREPVKAGLLVSLLVAVPVVTGLGGYLLANRDTIATGEQAIESARYERLLAEGMTGEIDGLGVEEGIAKLRQAIDLTEDPTEPVVLMAIRYLRDSDIVAARRLRSEFPVWKSSEIFRRVDAFIEDKAFRIMGPDEVVATDERPLVHAPSTPLEFLVEGLLAGERSSLAVSAAEAAVPHRLLTQAVHASPVARLHVYLSWLRFVAYSRDEGEIRRAVAAVESLWPGDPAAAGTLGFALSFCDPEAAIPYFEREIDAKGDSPPTLVNLAVCHRKCGRDEDAETYYRRAVAVEPFYLPAYTRFAEYLLVRGQYQEAKQLLDLANAESPRHPSVHAALAFYFKQQGDVTAALEATMVALKGDPNNAQSQYNAGIYHMKLRDPESAISFLEEAARIRPEWYLPWMNLGQCRSQLRDFPGAVDAFRNSLSDTHPDPGYTWLQIGIAQARFDLDASLVSLRRAEEIVEKPNVRRTLMWYLGLTCADLGLADPAVRAFCEHLEIDRSRAERFEESVSRNVSSAAKDARVVAMARAVLDVVDASARWAHDALLAVARRSEDHEGVRAELRRYVQIVPGDLEAWLDLAEHLADMSLPDTYQAPEAARRALARADACLTETGVAPSPRHAALRALLLD